MKKADIELLKKTAIELRNIKNGIGINGDQENKMLAFLALHEVNKLIKGLEGGS